jgi:1-acyl-sn-glycerol-3-phosphate acyltransferase
MPHVWMGTFLVVAFTRLALYEISDRFRPASATRARAVLQGWARWAWPWLRLQVEVVGDIPAFPCLFVANHRTYLDIPVLAGVLGATFLSRADVANWPLVGRIARLTETVLVARDDPRDRTRAARRVMRQLRSGSVVVFPEATTTGERLPAPFHPGTFRLVQRQALPIVPVTVRYSERRAYWVEDLSVWQHMKTRVLVGGLLRVVVHVGEPLAAQSDQDAAQLATAVHAAVCRPIDVYGELL